MENKRELLKKVFANEEVKRVPVGFWHHFILGKEQFRGLEDKLTDIKNTMKQLILI